MADDTPIWFRRLRLRQLELLLALQRHSTLTATAESLRLTQPAVSQQLAELEAALGEQLFERSRGLRPTSVGRAMLRYAEQALAGARRADDEFRALRSGASGLVRIGAMRVATTVLLPRAITRLRSAGDNLRLVVEEDILQGLWPRLERGELDLVVGRIDGRMRSSGLPFESLYEDPHVVVCRRGHPLARRRRPMWPDLLDYPWVLPPAGTALRAAVDASFGSLGLPPPQPWVDSGSVSTTLALLPMTDGLAVLSRTAARHHRAQGLLAVLPLALPVDVGPVGMTWSGATAGPARHRVIEALREEARLLNAA